ncbi:unnamed protein product [Ilex paraguariensis]|uniref:Uncharacterized protein n=1 Tax=Ilex paraguariensis TaxID=185542 RepID=A0ABC8UF05_9AQUA
MGDIATLAKARRELEDLYLGVPDDSVNLTFQDLAQVQQQQIISLEKKKSAKIEFISQVNPKKEGSLSSTSPPIPTLPSLNFNSGLQASSNQYNHHHVLNVVVSPRNRRSHPVNENGLHMSRGHHLVNRETHDGDYVHHRDHTGAHGHHHEHQASLLGFRPAFESSVVYDDISHLSGTSMASKKPTLERGGRRRQGIPHSNICTICSTYTYIFRHLVCGRAYCRYCVSVGMEEMTEGRKCIECLGKKFSQRPAKRVGTTT